MAGDELDPSNPASQLPTGEAPGRDVLISRLGTPFLAYVCNATEPEISSRIENATPLPTTAQEEVFEQTLATARALAANRYPMTVNNEPALEPISYALGRFGAYSEPHGMSFANVLRCAAGGSLPDPPNLDPLQQAVTSIARDAFPVLLLSHEGGELGLGRAASFGRDLHSHNHPEAEAVVSQLNEAAEPLRRFFSGGEVGDSRLIMSTSGRGGTIQAVGLASMLLSNAELRAGLHGRLTPESYLSEVASQIDELRELAAGKTISVPAAVGFASAQVSADFQLTTPWGELVPATTWHRARAPTQADLVFLTEFTLACDFDLPLDPGSWPGPSREFLEAHGDLERRVELLRLTLTLGLDRDPPVAVTPTWQFIADPTTYMGASGFTMSPPLSDRFEISEEDRPALEDWAATIDTHDHPSLRLAVRRTLGSIAMRGDPADGLVDAVIALENMFGTGQSEVGFRLSAALAWLLESAPEARVARQKAVGKLYSLRSKIVHGGEVDLTSLQSERVAASRLAVDGLRKLFADYPDLIPEGDQRGKLLILRGGAGAA